MASTSAFAAVKNGASLKGNEYTKGGNNAKGSGVIAWNSYSSVDPTAFSHDLSSGDLTVLKDGDYLVAVTVPLSASVGLRNTHRADLLVNGTAVPTALGESSYIRLEGGHSESSDHFAVLVALKANDVLTVKTTPTANNNLNSFIGTCSLYAELVEGDRNVFSASATAIQSGTNLNVEPDIGDQGLIWTSARKGSAYTHSDGDAEITIKDDGNYMVYVNVPLRGVIARGSVGLTVNLDEEYIEGARGQQGYIRNGNNHQDASIHFSGMIRAEAGQVLTVITEQLALAGTVTVQANRAASIFIEKLRNDGLFSDSFTGTTAGENLNPNNKFALALVGDGMSLDIIDNTTYANEGDNEENIVIKKAGSYLLTFNVTFTGGNARANPRVTVEVNGGVVPGATSLAHYLRHADGHDETTGSFVALLSDLAVDDVVTVSVQREGNGGIVTSPEGGKVALQAKAAYTAAAGDTSPPKLASFVGLGLDGFLANLEDFGLSVDAATIKAVVDGAEAAVTTSKDGSITTVGYAFASMPAPYSAHTVSLTYSDSAGNSYSNDFSFTIDVDYQVLPASIASTSVDKSSAGFIANVTQISTMQTESAAFIHGNSTANAEKQLAGLYINPNEFDDDDNNVPYLNEADPDAWEGWSISPVELDGAINWNQDEGAAIGNFGEDQSIPQIPGWGDSADGIVAEILGYLELSKGLHTLGVNSDDGFRLSFGPNPKDQLGIIAGEFEGGRGAADTIFNIVAEADGLYPVRLLWYEGGGGANVEFFSVDDKGTKILINDPDNADSIKAYRTADSAPYISRVAPAAGELSKTIEFDFVNGDLSVDKSSVKMKLNGEDATISTTSTDDGIAVVYDHGDYLPAGANTVELSYTESGGTARVRNYSITIPKGRIDILMDKPTVTVEFDDLTGDAGVGAIGNPGLTYLNAPELGVPALYPNGVGTAVRFDGSKDQRLLVADHADINITNGPWEEMSWEFWFKPEKLPTAGQTITLYEQGGNTRGVHLYLSGTQDSDPTEAEIYMLALNRAETIWGGTLNQVGDEGVTAVKGTVKLGSVYHVAFVMDGDPSGDLEGTLTGYINGRQVGQVSGVHLLYNHSDDIAFAYAAAQAVDHITGDRGEQPGLGFTGVLDDAAFYNTALSAEQVQAHFQGGFGSGDPQAIEITAQPQDATVQEADTATFSVEFTGSPLVDVKWLVNGEEAATDAVISGSSISIVATEANSGAKVKAELTNSVGTVTTAEVTLTTVVDTTAPEVASISAAAGTVNQVTIAFNEIVSAATAGDAANYTIEGLTVNSATLGADGKTVTLSTSQQTPGSYTVAISGVKDVSVRANELNGSASVETAISYKAEVLASGATIYIPFDDTEGTKAVGVGDPNPNANYFNGPELGVTGLFPNGGGTAVRFDGTKDHAVRVSDHKDLNVTNGPWEERTWEFWFKAETLPVSGVRQVIWEQGGFTRGINIYLNGSDNAAETELVMMAWNRAETFWGGATLSQVGDEGVTAVKTTVKAGEVYHLIFIMDGDPSGNLEGTLTGYLNGTKVGEVSGVHMLYNHGNDSAFGNMWQNIVDHTGDVGGSNGFGFTGVIDDAAFYSSALSEERIKVHYESALVVTAGPELATDKASYMSGEDITVNFSNGLGNPKDWVGIYKPDGVPGDVGSTKWLYVSGSSTAGEGLTEGALTFAGGLPAGSYVARFFENDGYTQIADAVAFTVVNPPGVSPHKAKYTPGESITVNFIDGPGNPKDWVGLYRPDMTPGDVSSLVWAYVGGTQTAGDGLTEGSVTFANGMAVGDYKAIYFENDGYGQLASTTFSVAAAELPEGVLFAEDFDGLALGPWVSDSESGGDGTDWTATAPTGWVMATGDGHGATAGGDTVTEFDGWTFVDPVTWNTTAGQERSQFTKGSGAIAVADSDEFDDKADAGFNASLSTPAIDISSSAAGSLVLTYDSSWRQEPQNGKVTVAFDGGAAVTLLELTPDTPTAYNETVSLNLDNPAGAQTAVISWEKQGHNNWWWAIDNIIVAVKVDGLSSAVAGLSTQALDSLVAHYDGKNGVETDGGSVVSWTPIDGNGGFLDGMIVRSTQRGGGAPELITYDGSGKLTFDDTDVGADGRYLEGALSNAESKEFTVFWVGNYSADAPFATSGTYVYNIGINSTSHQRDDGAGGFVVEQYNGTTYAGDDITAYDGVTTVWSTVLTADSHAFYANGTNLNVGGTPSNNVKANASMLIGAYSSSGYDFVGEVEQLIIFGSALSDADRELVEGYLGATDTPATPALSIVNNGDGSVTVTFEGKLQGASTVNGPWADVEGAVSPQIIPASEAMQFGRAVK